RSSDLTPVYIVTQVVNQQDIGAPSTQQCRKCGVVRVPERVHRSALSVSSDVLDVLRLQRCPPLLPSALHLRGFRALLRSRCHRRGTGGGAFGRGACWCKYARTLKVL